MFGGNSWTGQKDQRLFFVNPPQPPPKPPSLLTQQFPYPHYPLSNSTPRTNHAPSWSNPLPLPPPFPNCFENVDVIGPNRLGYLAPTPGNFSNKAKTVDVVEREATRPATIDESEYNILQNKVKCSMTNSQKDDARQIHSLTEHTSLLKHPTKHKPLPKSFSPHARQPIEQSTYPSRKRDMDAMQQTQEFKQRRYQRYTADSGEYVVQTSTKLVRKRATTPKPTQNTMKWTRDQAAEEANTSAGSAKDTPEPEIEIVLVDSSQNSDDNAPQISPNGVMVVCETARTPDPVSRVTERAHSPEKTVHKSGSSSNHHTPGSVLPNRGQMSLRNINGHRITGDSRECFAHLTSSCKAGIFCRFEHRGSTAHHETKVCQRLLRGLCRPDSEQCRCEHAALLLHQYPLCVFFGRGDCVEGDKCTLLHVKHSTAARLCPEFLRGNCFAGDKCDYVHSYPYIVTKEKGTLEEITLPVEKSESTFRWIED